MSLTNEQKNTVLRLMHIYFRICFIILLAFAANIAASQQRSTILYTITVNGKPVDGANITLARSDSISFELRCKIDSTIEPDPFLFNISLRASRLGQRQQQTLGTTAVTYTGLPEDKYAFAVQAILPGEWTALPASIEFTVNDSAKAAIRREQIAAEKNHTQNMKPDSVKPNPTNTSNNSFDVAWGALGGVALLAAGAAIVAFRRLRDKKKRVGSQNINKKDALLKRDRKNKKINQKFNNETPSVFMNDETLNSSHVELTAENEKLRAEVAALRNQVDNLQTRSEELLKQNKALEETIARIESSKSELEDLQTQKDELFATIIHDIKNPAGIIKGLVELLRSYDLNATEQQEVMDDLMETSKKIISLSQQVCRIMALEAGQVRLSYEKINIADIINSVSRRNEANAKAKNIVIQTEIAANLPSVELDPQRIEDVVDNLVSNAVKFSNNGASIRLRAKREGECIVVEVSDNGVGMTEEDIKRAFNRGAILSARPTAGEPSSGLGLWIVKRLVEDHKGRVWVRSTLGRGSTFSFQIPLLRS